MKVMIISAGFLPMSPVGPAYIAGAALSQGHEVRVFDCLFHGEDKNRLEKDLALFNPDAVAVSIPVTTIPFRQISGTPEAEDTKPKIKALVDTVKRKSRARIIAGGSGFNFFSEDWLAFLEIETGLRGESEASFPLLLSRLSRGEPLTGIPGSVIMKGDRVLAEPGDAIENLDAVAMPAYELFDTEQYNGMKIPWGISTKRGCSFECIHCSAGMDFRYRLKSPARVAEEIKYVMRVTGSKRVNFSDNSFNCPITHAKSVCRQIIDQGLEVRWRSGTFKPLGFSREFCSLLKASGCSFVGLAMETGSPRMLSNLNRGYRVEDIITALDNLRDSGMDFGVSILVGAPGETMASVRETIRLVDEYPEIKAVWVNIGVFGWRQRGLKDTGAGRGDAGSLFENPYFLSPELDEEDMEDLIDDLSLRSNFLIQVNCPWPS